MRAGSSNHSRDILNCHDGYFKIVFLNIYNCTYKTPFVNSKDQIQVKRNKAIATGVHTSVAISSILKIGANVLIKSHCNYRTVQSIILTSYRIRRLEVAIVDLT